MSDKNLDLESPLSDTPESETVHNSESGQPGKRGGGPRTPEGKKRSSLNARRHGLTARIHIATPEESAVYDAHLKSYLEAFAPAGVVERDLVIELASLRHRLKRVASLEDSIFALGIDRFAESLSSHPQTGAAFAEGMTWLRDGKNIQLLSLYESRLRKAAEKTQTELERLQKARKEAHAHAQRQAIQLAKVAVSKGKDYEPGGDFLPARDHGQFVFSTDELVRAVDRQNRLSRSYSLPDLETKSA